MADYEERYKVEPQCNPDFPAYVWGVNAPEGGSYYVGYRPTQVKRVSDTHPEHYAKYTIEPVDVIEDWDLPFHLGNVIKYISRYRDKGGKSDLEKAQWYLNRFVCNYEDKE